MLNQNCPSLALAGAVGDMIAALVATQVVPFQTLSVGGVVEVSYHSDPIVGGLGGVVPEVTPPPQPAVTQAVPFQILSIFGVTEVSHQSCPGAGLTGAVDPTAAPPETG